MKRLREFAERPVSPGVARAILVTALAVTAGFGCVVALGLGARREASVGHRRAETVAVGSVEPAAPPAESHDHPAGAAHRRQDPQDRPGTAVHRRAARELVTHRALQHLPWSGDEVSIRLVGAEAGRAILTVVGPSAGIDRRVYRAFLSRFDDDGRSYVPHFLIMRGGRS